MARILIVDDEPAIRFLIYATLENEGYELLEAKDGLEADGLSLTAAPDLIILDVMMPGLSGYELCARLKADPARRNIIILMLTAKVQGDDREKAAAAGVDHYLPKPFSPAELIRVVDDLLQSRKQEGPN